MPDPDYVRLRVAHCGICGSDLEFYRGYRNASYPRTLGHEYYGSVVLLGENVRSFNLGDQVAVDPNYRCGQCIYCKSGTSNLCALSESNLFTRRGFSNYVDLHHSYLHKLPSLNPRFLGALVEPLSCAIHAVELASVKETDRILVLGCGGQGSMMAFGLTRLFPRIPISVYDPVAERSILLSSTYSPNVSVLAKPPSDAGYSLVFEASGQPAGFKHASMAVEKGGRIIVSSRYRGRRRAHLNESLPRKECSVRFSHLNGNGESFVQAINLLKNDWSSRFDRLINVQPFLDIDKLFARMEASPYCKTILTLS